MNKVLYIQDNYDLFKEHEREQERRLRRRPVCHECGERITEEYGFQFSGKWFCPDCIDQHKVYIDED